MTDMSEKEQAPPTFSRRKTLLYSLLPAMILFGGLELGARILEIWLPPLTLDYGWGFNEDSRVFMEAGLLRRTMVTRPEKLVSFRMQTFAMPKPPDTFRVVILGGSNVHYMFDPLQRMAERLSATPGERRRFEVINLGGLAYGSHRLRIMLPEVLHYRPDAVLIYSGHNEFEELRHQALVDTARIPVQRVAYSLAMLRLLRDGCASLELAHRFALEIRHERPPEVDYMAAAAHEFSDAEIAERMALYRENLGHMLEQCRNNGVPVVISTVATNYWAPDLHERYQQEKERIREYYASGRYAEGLELARTVLRQSPRHQASDVENGIIRELAAEFGVTLVDGERLIEAAEPHGVTGETLLSDRCHLTETGREIIVAAFEQELRRIAGPAAGTPQ